jgi:hypothetical protein
MVKARIEGMSVQGKTIITEKIVKFSRPVSHISNKPTRTKSSIKYILSKPKKDVPILKTEESNTLPVIPVRLQPRFDIRPWSASSSRIK